MNTPRPGDVAWPLEPRGRHSRPAPWWRWLIIAADVAVMLVLLHVLGVT